MNAREPWTPLLPVCIVVVLAWGAFAFGAVYDWAYAPLAWTCAAIGLVGLFVRGARAASRFNRPLVTAIGLMSIAALAQLAPLSPETIRRVSPATDRFLASYDVGYARLRQGYGGQARIRQGEGAQADVRQGDGGSAEALDAGPESAEKIAASYTHPLSVNPAATWLGLGCLAAFGLLMLGTARGLGRRGVRALAGGLAVLGFALALAGIIQSGLYSRDPSPTLKVYGLWQPMNVGAHPFGPFINRNHFAGWMLLALPVVLGYFSGLVARGMRGVKPTLRDRVLWFSSPDASKVILVGLAALVMALSLVLTLSRSGITGLLIAVAISAAFIVRRQARGSKRGVLLLYVAFLVALSVGWAGLDAIVVRFSNASSDFFGTRFIAWGDAWSIVRDFPLVGTGLNTYGYATLFYQTTNFGGHFVEAHNDYLQLLAEGGLLLAVPAAVAIFLLAREIRRRFKEGQDDTMSYWLRVGATTALVAIALQEVVEFSLQIPGIAALFAVVAAIAIHEPEPRAVRAGRLEDRRVPAASGVATGGVSGDNEREGRGSALQFPAGRRAPSHDGNVKGTGDRA